MFNLLFAFERETNTQINKFYQTSSSAQSVSIDFNASIGTGGDEVCASLWQLAQSTATSVSDVSLSPPSASG